MAKTRNRVYSHYAKEALALLATRIRSARLERRVPAREIAERAGISRDLLYRIERADPVCSIGVVFEVATLLRIPLFHDDYDKLVDETRSSRDRLALLPGRARKRKVEVDDDF